MKTEAGRIFFFLFFFFLWLVERKPAFLHHLESLNEH